jgi:hypothetical protein
MDTKDLILVPKEAIELATFYRDQIAYYERIHDEYMAKQFKVRYEAVIQITDKYLSTTVAEFNTPINSTKIYQYALGIGEFSHRGNHRIELMGQSLPQRMLPEEASVVQDATIIKEQIEKANELADEAKLDIPRSEIATKVMEKVDNNRIFSVNNQLEEYTRNHPEHATKDKNDVILLLSIERKYDVFKAVRDIAANIAQFSSLVAAKTRLKTILYNWSGAEIERFLSESLLLRDRRLEQFKLGKERKVIDGVERNIFIAPPADRKSMFEVLADREEKASIKICPSDANMEPTLRRDCAKAWLKLVPMGKDFDRKRRDLLRKWKDCGDPAYNKVRNEGK